MPEIEDWVREGKSVTYAASDWKRTRNISETRGEMRVDSWFLSSSVLNGHGEWFLGDLGFMAWGLVLNGRE